MPATAAVRTAAAREAAYPYDPPLRVVRGGRYGMHKLRRLARRVGAVAVMAVMLALIVGVIYSQAQITRISGDIDIVQRDLANAQSTYDYLSTKMSDITSSTNVQQIAEGRLGLVRADASQITYIKLQEESTVEQVRQEGWLVFDGFRTAALSLIGRLDP